MPFGFTDCLLRINLTSGTFEKEAINKEVAKNFLGGKGYASHLLFEELKTRSDPLGPNNKLVFMTGPLTGTPAPVPNRFCVCTKSPLTGGWLDSHCGGWWGPELKFAGYDGIIVEGKAKKPTYIFIEDDLVELKDAETLWGADTFSTERILKDKHSEGRTPRLVEIGPAGEKKALLASVVSEVRAAGRGGAGAVMGSKNLKAIVVKGSKYKPKDLVRGLRAFRSVVATCYKKIYEEEKTSVRQRGSLPIYGTANIIDGINESGGWPTRNFQSGSFEHVKEINGSAFAENLWVPRNGPGARPCYACPIVCAHVSVIQEGRWAGTLDEGPEYETIWSFGAQCGIRSREAIARADYLCDYYGLDTISIGSTIGFLMECYQKRLVTKEDVANIDLNFGNEQALINTIEKAGTMIDDLGKLVANGVKRASEHIGKNSENFAIHVKGLEIPAYDPRSAQGMGLAYAVSDRGACHLHAWTAGAEMLGWDGKDPKVTKGKAADVKEAAEVTNVAWDSSGLCRFAGFALDKEDVHRMIVAATGFDYSLDDFVQVGERINNLVKMFNLREGLTSKDDTLPRRLLEEPMPMEPCEGQRVRLDEMLPEYYRLCGWDKNGRPTKDKLKELGLEFTFT